MRAWHRDPSGKVEEGATYLEAAARELCEEVGITVASTELRFVHAIERSLHGKDPWVGMFFEAGRWSEPVNREPHKHSEMEWFARNALPENTVGYVRHVVHAIARREVFTEWTE